MVVIQELHAHKHDSDEVQPFVRTSSKPDLREVQHRFMSDSIFILKLNKVVVILEHKSISNVYYINRS
jgi:hypothetical protein